jgi:hypothetical protein
MKCTTSEITLPAFPQASLGNLESVLWTQSAVDMADAVITAVAAGAITIFEGSPGRGKTAVAYAVLCALGMQCTRINLSPTTSAEDLFGREIPQSLPEGGFATGFVAGPLTLAMQRSCLDSPDQQLPSQAVLLDEINLASPQLLERLEGFMLRMVRSARRGDDRYLLPNGKDVFHRAIVIVATMNSAALSNARSSLSTKLQGASHFLRLIPFTKIELEVLAGTILAEPGQTRADPGTLEKVLNAHEIAAKLLERESGSASERDAVTLREFLRFRQFRQACKGFGTDILIELAYGTQFGANVANELLKSLNIRSQFNVTMPLIRQRKLLLTDVVALPLFRESADGPVDLPLTTEQLRVACFIGAAVMAHRPVGLFGVSGSGKTHLTRL